MKATSPPGDACGTGVDEDAGVVPAAKFAVLLPHLDERQRRLVLAAEAGSLGRGGFGWWRGLPGCGRRRSLGSYRAGFGPHRWGGSGVVVAVARRRPRPIGVCCPRCWTARSSTWRCRPFTPICASRPPLSTGSPRRSDRRPLSSGRSAWSVPLPRSLASITPVPGPRRRPASLRRPGLRRGPCRAG
jgi:hypothetical protein